MATALCLTRGTYNMTVHCTDGRGNYGGYVPGGQTTGGEMSGVETDGREYVLGGKTTGGNMSGREFVRFPFIIYFLLVFLYRIQLS